MWEFKQSETVNARRRSLIYLTDVYDGSTPKTGVTSPTLLLSKNGNAYAVGSGTFAEMGSGNYYYEYHTGEIDTLGFINLICAKSGATDFNSVCRIVAYDPYDPAGITSNIKSVSGIPVQLSDFKTGVTLSSSENVYFANIKLIRDSNANRDEYGVQWYRNTQVLGSGDITTPYITVYKTSDGTALISPTRMDYVSVNLGVLRHNQATNVVTSGEPYLAVVSGVIDSAVKEWRNIVGLDLL